MKHTPGPWNVESVHSEALHEICMTNPPPGEGDPVVLASVSYDEDRGTCPTLQEANANARLMAAAPDLLEACKLFELAQSEWLRDDGIMTFGEWMDHHKVSGAIRAAIMKAGASNG